MSDSSDNTNNNHQVSKLSFRRGDVVRVRRQTASYTPPIQPPNQIGQRIVSGGPLSNLILGVRRVFIPNLTTTIYLPFSHSSASASAFPSWRPSSPHVPSSGGEVVCGSSNRRRQHGPRLPLPRRGSKLASRPSNNPSSAPRIHPHKNRNKNKNP